MQKKHKLKCEKFEREYAEYRPFRASHSYGMLPRVGGMLSSGYVYAIYTIDRDEVEKIKQLESTYSNVKVEFYAYNADTCDAYVTIYDKSLTRNP